MPDTEHERLNDAHGPSAAGNNHYSKQKWPENAKKMNNMAAPAHSMAFRKGVSHVEMVEGYYKSLGTVKPYCVIKRKKYVARPDGCVWIILHYHIDSKG